MHKSYLWSVLFAFCLFLTGCGDQLESQIEQQIPLTKEKLDSLGRALESGQVRNATLIKQYAEKVIQINPELSSLANEFLKDASVNGQMYKSLRERFDVAAYQPQIFADKQEQFDELVNLFKAADPVLFSDALSDPLNVLADMSGGALPRVNALSKSQSMAANGAQDFGVGSQLIGNPSYGYWNTGANGMSFWVWYGIFSMMDDVFDYKRKRVYYNHWGRYRGYSYYHDYGRKRYTSPKKWKEQSSLEKRTRKNFGSKGFNSAYSKNRTGASSLSSQSKKAQASSNRFRSSGSKSTYAKRSSFRNSSSSTSRGFRRGK